MVEVQKITIEVERKLIGVKGRSGLITHDLDEWIVGNQGQFGKTTGDYAAMVLAHREISAFDRILGMRERIIRRMVLELDGNLVEFKEAHPSTKNIWVGEYVELLPRDQAAKIPYSGQTALYWATINGQVPDFVVKVDNGYFYPATANDIVINQKI